MPFTLSHAVAVLPLATGRPGRRLVPAGLVAVVAASMSATAAMFVGVCLLWHLRTSLLRGTRR